MSGWKKLTEGSVEFLIIDESRPVPVVLMQWKVTEPSLGLGYAQMIASSRPNVRLVQRRTEVTDEVIDIATGSPR